VIDAPGDSSPFVRRVSPRVRIAAAFTCPGCDLPVEHAAPRTGESFHQCPVQRRARDARGCRAHWLNIVLTPGMTAGALHARLGSREARSMLSIALPETAGMTDEAVWPVVLVPYQATAPGHLQVVTQPRDVYLYVHHPLTAILRALSLL